MDCDVDYCQSAGTQTLTATTDDDDIVLHFCKPCADALQAYLAAQRDVGRECVDLYSDRLVGTIGELQAAIGFLDGAGFVPQGIGTA